MTARKTSVAVTPQIDRLIGRRGENFSAALRQMIVAYDYVVSAGRASIGKQRLAWFTTAPRRAALERVWSGVVLHERSLGVDLVAAASELPFYAPLRELTALELIALYDTVLQQARVA